MDKATLTESGVVDYLVAADVLAADDVVDTGLSIETSGRRNRNLRLTWPDGSGYFVKLPDDRSPMSRATLRSEAEFYRAASGWGYPFDALLASVVLADPNVPLLALELKPQHLSLRDLVSTGWPGKFPIAVFRAVGRLLGEIQAAGLEPRGTLPLRPVSPAVAPVANYGRPDPWLLGTASRGTLMLIEMLQGSAALSAGLTHLIKQWQPETLVHGDVRADNILVAHPADRPRDLRIVDWELWHVGDPAQDLAGLLESIVSATIGRALVRTAAADGNPSDQPDLDTATVVMQATCHAVWQDYLLVRRLSPGARRTVALRTAAFTAARIVQSEVEVAGRSEAVSTQGCDMLQVAENVFADPERAAIEFLALT